MEPDHSDVPRGWHNVSGGTAEMIDGDAVAVRAEPCGIMCVDASHPDCLIE